MQVVVRAAMAVGRVVARCTWDIRSSGPSSTYLTTETRGLNTSRCMAVEAEVAAGLVALTGSVAVVVAGMVRVAARPVQSLILNWL